MPPAKDPYRYFRLEARELLDALRRDAAALEDGPVAEAVSRLLRSAHTLKGAARVVKQAGIAEEAHAIEDVLAPIRDTGVAAPDARDAITTHLATVERLLQQLDHAPSDTTSGDIAPADATPAAAAPLPMPSPRPQTVRTEIGEIDRVLEGLSEIHMRIGGMRDGLLALEEAQRVSDLLEANLAPRAFGSANDTNGNAVRAHALAAELAASFGDIEQDLAACIDQADRELGLLRETIEQMRLIPASLLFGPTELAGLEAAHMVGKQVRFQCDGGDVRLDAPVIEAMQRALIQLVRNALAHGIGTPAQRTSVDKPAAGLIKLSVVRHGDRVAFDFSDDGNGVDIDTLRRVAKERGLPDFDEADQSDGLLRVLMASGVSTAEKVTDVAGRGVGLDIVREVIEQLNGTVSIRSETRQGTHFRIVMPLSLASMEALQLECTGARAALPLEMIAGALRLEPGEVSARSEGTSIEYEGVPIPFMPLEQLLHGTAAQEARMWSAIVLRDGNSMAAIGIDKLLGASRIVVRPLPALTPCDPIVAGTWLDGQGNARLLLDGPALIAAISGRRAPVARRQLAPPHILVIDDSMTTRMLEESILLSAGYAVDTATSAEEGLEAARKRRYDLFLVDVEMPGMDGFTFVQTIRADPDLQDIPAILVSSRNAAEDFQRGTDAGAQGYMVKGEFDQRKLLSLIRDLTGQ